MAVLFTNPVVAQQAQAAAQNALAQRQLDLQDREALLSGLRQAQESAQRYGAQRYQTDAYRDVGMEQNRVGMARVQGDVANAGRKLDLESVIAENNRRFQDQELATRKAIAEINANAMRLRPQDVVDLEQTVASHNEAANEFNATAPNAAAIIQQLANDLRQQDEDRITKEEDGFWTSNSAAREKAKKMTRPYGEYVAKALASQPDLLPYVQIEGDSVSPKLKALIQAQNGKLVPVEPKLELKAPKPAPSTNNPAALIRGVVGGVNSPITLTNRATGRAFTASLIP